MNSHSSYIFQPIEILDALLPSSSLASFSHIPTWQPSLPPDCSSYLPNATKHTCNHAAQLMAVRAVPRKAQPAALLHDGVACAASAHFKVARLRFVDADLLGGSDDGAGVGCFDEDAATDYGRSRDSYSYSYQCRG